MPGQSDFTSLVTAGTDLARGWAEPVYPADPAAGATVAQRIVPGETWERMLLARATFTADTTAGVRNPRLEIVDALGRVLYGMPLTQGVAPSGVVTANVAVNGADEVVGPGPMLDVSNAAPAAGADWTYTVPAGQSLVVETLQFSLVTGVTVANRTVQVIIDDGANELWRWVSPTVQAASTTVEYVGAQSSVEYGAVRNGVEAFELPNLILGPGYRVRTVTVNIQATDQYSAQRLAELIATSVTSVQRWPDIPLQSGYVLRFIHDGVGAADSWSSVRFYLARYPSDATRGMV